MSIDDVSTSISSDSEVNQKIPRPSKQSIETKDISGELTTEQKVKILWDSKDKSIYSDAKIRYPFYFAFVTACIWFLIPVFMNNDALPELVHKSVFRTNAAIHSSIHSMDIINGEMDEEEYDSSLHGLLSGMIQNGQGLVFSDSYKFSYGEILESSFACKLAGNTELASLLEVNVDDATRLCGSTTYASVDEEGDEVVVEERDDKLLVKLSNSYTDYARQWQIGMLARADDVVTMWIIARAISGVPGTNAAPALNFIDLYLDSNIEAQDIPDPGSKFYSRMIIDIPLKGNATHDIDPHIITLDLNSKGQEFMSNRNQSIDPFILVDVLIRVERPKKSMQQAVAIR